MIQEEDIILGNSYKGADTTKKVPVFFNPLMKLNRDISLLLIASYFEKPIQFCDPLCASGIRELRFLDVLPEAFEKLTCGDISKTALTNFKKHLKANKLSSDKINFHEGHAINTLSQAYFDFIEIDPFGSPVPFLDMAFQRVKHKGIIAVTATDTAALCGTYPKTSLRKYGIRVEKTLYFEELGLRNLIAYCMREAAKYEKSLTPLISYSKRHYFRIFFKVEESRTKAYKKVKDELKYIQWDKNTQKTKVVEYEGRGALGKTYVGTLNDKSFIKGLSENLFLLKDAKEAEDLLKKLSLELDTIGYINPHKLAKCYKRNFTIKFEDLMTKLMERGYRVSRAHNNPLGIKTNASHKVLLKYFE